jgi:hypothetical protein
MKILIRDYSSELLTEPQDLYIALKKLGLEVILWNENELSTFDVFDKYNPDIFINSFDFSNALRKRLRLSEIPIIHRCKLFEDDFVKSWFKERAIIHDEAPPCNLFIKELITPFSFSQEKIDYMVLIDSDEKKIIEEIIKDIPKGSTYHIISLGQDDIFDLKMSIGQVYSVAHMYKKIIMSPIVNQKNIKINLTLLGCEVDSVSYNESILNSPYDFLMKIIKKHIQEVDNPSESVRMVLSQLYSYCQQGQKYIESNFNTLDNTK